VEVAQNWRLAAPNSIIENIYGPTELTIACTAYRWDDSTSPSQCEQGIVPIGEPFDDMEALIIDPQLRQVNEGKDGELAMTGPQLTLGYWHDEEKTSRAFVEIPGANGTYYRTGDRVRRRGPGQPLLYLGRLDSQLKVLGHRVELGEVEAAIRKACGIDGVVALGWPLSGSGADGIEAFVQGETLDTSTVLARLKESLPFYMVPRHIHLLSHFPLNANGKFDRGALLQKLRQSST
jgi:acyl-CoA synthetase (AMP-forming)/AMP-acid ligase II